MRRLAAVCALALLTAHLGAAQDLDLELSLGDYCTLRVVDGVAQTSAPLNPAVLSAARRVSGTSRVVTTVGERSTFVVKYTGFTPEAEAAFQAAVDVWADHLQSRVAVRVEADFGELDETTLGAAGPLLAGTTQSFNEAILANVWYPRALIDAVGDQDFHPPQASDNPNTDWDDTFNPDIIATFNSGFDSFYFGTDGAPGATQYDFRTVVLHELGHGLGFVGSGDYDDGTGAVECDGVAGHGCWGLSGGTSTFPILFDRFVEDGDGTAMLNATEYPQNSAVLGDLLTSNGRTTSLENKNLFFDGTTVRTANQGRPGPLYAPRPAESGSSFSHWDEFVYPFTPGAPMSDALMTPGIARGETYADPGALTCAAMKDMGWGLGPGCDGLFVTPAEAGPEAGALALALTGPNPFRSATTFHLDAAEATLVSVRLVDALGREVRALYEGPVGSGGVEVRVDGAGLAAGVYGVHVVGTPVAVRVVRMR